MPVYIAAFPGFLPSAFSDFDERYSDDDILKAAAIPVILPVSAIRLELPNASVYPAKAPVNSTNASFSPSTTDPIYCNFSSSIMAMNFCSCSSSCSAMLSISG